MKKIISFVLSLCMSFSLCFYTYCAANETKNIHNDKTVVLEIDNPYMTVNGIEKEIDPGRGTVPIIRDNRTLIPVRAVIEEIGGTVTWDEKSRTVCLEYGNDAITLIIGASEAYLNETPYMLDAEPIVLNDRTMLPIRFIMESFGYSVLWDDDSRRITIEKSKAQDNESEEKSKALVVYFSMPETDTPGNMTTGEENSTVVIDGKVLGNTQYIAYIIEEYTKADIFRIEPKSPYTTNHADLVEQAAKEKEVAARPELLKTVENIADYDTIFIGYPNWWGDLPMILYTFLETHDLSGKTVIPFNTHGGSGFSDTINTIKEIQPNANVIENGFTVSRNNVHDAEENVIKWLKELGYAKE